MIYIVLITIIVVQAFYINDLKDEIGYLKRKHLRRIADVSNREPIEIKKVVGGVKNDNKK